jgi:hypothetical protein
MPRLRSGRNSAIEYDHIDRIELSVSHALTGSAPAPRQTPKGAANFTQRFTVDRQRGSAFEFVRNAAFHTRVFFGRRPVAQPGRRHPFVRDEFGFTNGGPVTADPDASQVPVLRRR